MTQVTKEIKEKVLREVRKDELETDKELEELLSRKSKMFDLLKRIIVAVKKIKLVPQEEMNVWVRNPQKAQKEIKVSNLKDIEPVKEVKVSNLSEVKYPESVKVVGMEELIKTVTEQNDLIKKMNAELRNVKNKLDKK